MSLRTAAQSLQASGMAGLQYLKASNLQVLWSGVGDGFLDLRVGRRQHHGDIPLPGLTQHANPASYPMRDNLLQLVTPADHCVMNDTSIK